MYALSLEVMFIQLRLLFQRLMSTNLLVNVDKCKFLKLCIPYLGNVLEQGLIRLDPARVEALVSWEFPATTWELRSFIGAAAMLSSYVPDCGHLSGLLHPSLSRKTPYLPTQQQLNAFHEMKEAIQKRRTFLSANRRCSIVSAD